MPQTCEVARGTRREFPKSPYIASPAKLKVYEELHEERACRLCEKPFLARKDEEVIIGVQEEVVSGARIEVAETLTFNIGVCHCDQKHPAG